MHSVDGGRISWERDSTCTVDSDEETERWQNRLQEVTTLNCNMMIQSLHCVTTEEIQQPVENTAIDEG